MAEFSLLSQVVEKIIPGSTTDLREGELDAPDLTLVAETILANNLELRVPVRMLISHSKT